MTFLQETAEESADDRSIAQELGPFPESEVGGNEAAFPVAAVVHEAEEIIDKGLMGRSDIAEVVN